jgi:hypothetical protein
VFKHESSVIYLSAQPKDEIDRIAKALADAGGSAFKAIPSSLPEPKPIAPTQDLEELRQLMLREKDPEKSIQLALRRQEAARAGDPPGTMYRKDSAGDPPNRGDPPIGSEIRPLEVKSFTKFLSELTPLSHVVDGVLSGGSLYTLTGKTGVGKTSWLAAATLAIITGEEKILRRAVMKGRVAICTVENPNGLRRMLSVAAYTHNIDPNKHAKDLVIIDKRASPEDILAALAGDVAKNGPFAAIFIDTFQAFYDGHNASNPTEAQRFIARFRPFAFLSGEPTVIVVCHPTKYAGNEDLLPGGGGSILNEVDGNLTLSTHASGYIELSTQGKLRDGPFDPLSYRIERLCSPDVINAKGVQIPIPVMRPVTEQDVEEREEQAATQDAKLLKAMYDEPKGSWDSWGQASGLKKRQVQSKMERLAKQRPALVAVRLRKWRLTTAGERAVEEFFGLPPGAKKGNSKSVRENKATSRRTAKRTARAKTVREEEKLQ